MLAFFAEFFQCIPLAWPLRRCLCKSWGWDRSLLLKPQEADWWFRGGSCSPRSSPNYLTVEAAAASAARSEGTWTTFSQQKNWSALLLRAGEVVETSSSTSVNLWFLLRQELEEVYLFCQSKSPYFSCSQSDQESHKYLRSYKSESPSSRLFTCITHKSESVITEWRRRTRDTCEKPYSISCVTSTAKNQVIGLKSGDEVKV